MDSNFKEERPPHPRAKANTFEILTFTWIFKLFVTGHKRDLEINDLYSTLNDHSSSLLGNELEKKWKMELAKAKMTNRHPSLLRALIHMFGPTMMFYGFLLSIVEILLKMCQPIFIRGLLAYFDPDGPSYNNLREAYLNASCLVLCILATRVLYHPTQLEIIHCGMKMRVACCSTIFSKALRLSKTALGETTIGQLVNLLSNDVNRFDEATVFLHYLWIGPLETIVVTYFLWQDLGVSSIIGVASLLMFIPFQGWLGKKTSEFRMKTAIRTDKRIGLMNEIIMGIEVIKMYTWEKSFAYLIENARKKEIQQISGVSYIKGILLSCIVFQNTIALFVSIFMDVLFGNFITAQKVFVITTYFNILRTTMIVFFPRSISLVAEMLISIRRLQGFLMLEERNTLVSNRSKADKASNVVRKPIIINNGISPNNFDNLDDSENLSDLGIVISNATAKWTDIQTENSLENINLTVRPGRLVAVIGPVGAGKSSLIQAILRELPLTKGNISVRGVVSYASQEPWLFGGSVQQNILFGLPMDKERYKKIIKVCALKTDFEQFPYGDRTIVGERGISLSGGQRARINLARAVYKKADIYLLDDPLSAVDTHVGSHLFEKCIKEYLKEKTCILITHQLQYLTKVDQIILMENTHILAKGTYNELQASGLNFTKLLGPLVETSDLSDDEYIKYLSTSNLNAHCLLLRQDSVQSIASSIDDTKHCDSIQDEPIKVAETRSSGNVSLTVYSSYIFAGGNVCKIIFLLFMCVLAQVLASGGDYWITFWINLEEHIFRYANSVNNNTLTFTYNGNGTSTFDEISDTLLWWTISRQTCIIVYAIFIFSLVLTSLTSSAMFVSVCMKASMNLHNNMFNAITRATMYFFNTNSSGRILNRFSKDMGAIDELMPNGLIDCTQVLLKLSGTIIVIGIVNILLVIPTIIVGIIYYKISIFYLSTSRSVKRLEGVTKSPVLTHLNASLQGLTTIRAFEVEQMLCKEFDNHQDLHSSAYYLTIASNRAFAFWSDIISIIYISGIIFSFLVINNETYAANVGLIITQAMGMTGFIHWAIRQSAEVDKCMTSVERVLEYTYIPQESALESPPNKKSYKEWLQRGQIIFNNFYLRYSLDTPYVLKNLNIKIEPMEKVGIVGRTGAGKSSLIVALFRLALNEGSIYIDNLDINTLGLHELRSKISIIPQEPVLFSGTMRKNLDPFDEYPDHALWDALDEVELKDVIEDLPGGLNTRMSEGGSNFSVGQKQLVCLARAIVRNNKILVLDEATANVDPQTNALIQNTIRNKFRKCTVLTIAHRLNTVMDSDKVLVMDAGKLVEFDHPYNLLKNKDGFLYKLVEQTGRATADSLRSVAAESHKSIQRPMESTVRLIDEDVDNISNRNA